MLLEQIRERLANRFPEGEVDAIDFRGGDHIHVTVVSELFAGMPAIRRHQLIHALFTEEVEDGEIHALRITSLTPGEHHAHNLR